MSRENAGAPPKVCGVCLRPLDYLVAPGDETGRYVHANEEWGKRTHAVVPVDPDEVIDAIKPVCDFCFVTMGPGVEEWTVVTHPFAAQVLPDVWQNFSSLWAACADCKALIERRRWSGLVSRVTKEMSARHPAGPQERAVRKQGVKALYTLVEVNFVSLRPAAASDSYEGDFAPDPREM